MDLYAKGQLSFLILNCLLERDFYGLDFISEIYNRSNGRINLKKPSVYSNLTRMEKQGYVSSYLQSSDLGPNRKYYSITESGRRFYSDLKDYFDRNNIDVFRDFNDGNEDSSNQNVTSPQVQQSPIHEEAFNDENEDEEELDTNDYFDFSDIDGSQTEKRDYFEIAKTNEAESVSTSSKEEPLQQPSTLKTIESETTIQEEENNNEKETPAIIDEMESSQPQLKEEPKKNDAVFISSKDVDEYNKRIYDISKDINKYRKKRSFAEDQISMVATDSLTESNERTRASIENFKSSIESKDVSYQKNNTYNYSRHMSQRFPTINQKKEKDEEPHQDDGKFITKRIDASTVEKARKIEPPRLKIIPEYGANKETKLPAPKRDRSIDPSHKEILSRLYSRSNNENKEIREDALYDYNDLKSFYNDQNISFNVYKKPAEKNEHNTNKLYLYLSLFIFLLTATFSAILFISLMQTGNLNSNTNFLFILLPALVIIDVLIKFYNYKKYRGWLPSQMIPQWQIWLYSILGCGVVVGLNFIFGLNTTNFDLYATTLILPMLMIIALLPIRYYLKRYMLIKYWK